MSYEGREYFICTTGHLTVQDAWASAWDAKVPCLLNCKAIMEWRFGVNDTNCQGVEPQTILVKEIETCRCHCGHTHILKDALYKPDLNQKGWIRLTT